MAEAVLSTTQRDQNSMYVFFSKWKTHTILPDVYILWEKLQVGRQYKNLGIITDSRLSFKSQVKRVCDRVKH